MHRYLVRLTLKDGESLEGKALDTARNEDKQECIKLAVDSTEQLVVLDTLSKLEVLVDNPHFQLKTFD
jgi:Rho-binding antiterminator